MESHEIKSNSEGDRIDYGIILSVMLLALIGLVSIYLATAHDTTTLQNPVRATIMQAAWYVIGGVGIFFVMRFDAEQLWRIAPYLYRIGIFLMIAVLIFMIKRRRLIQGLKAGLLWDR